LSSACYQPVVSVVNVVDITKHADHVRGFVLL